MASYKNDAIYVCGGMNSDDNVLKSVLCLSLDADPGKVKFKPVADMNEARVFASACTASDSLYVFGGLIGLRSYLSSIEILNLAVLGSTW